MNTMIFKMSAELNAINIRPIGVYASLPYIMAEAVETVKMFGYDTWSANSCLGNALKAIVKKYAEA